MSDDDDKKSWGSGGLFANRELGSLALIFFTQVFCVPFFLICKDFNGSFLAFITAAGEYGAIPFMMKVWPTPFDPYVWKMLLSFMAFELFLMRAVPGKVFKATPTASGHIPIYNANGVQCYLITLVALFAIAKYDIWNPADVYDNMPKILSSLNVFALGFCTMLTVKGLTFPSNLIVEFFWGTELYPRILGFDVKQFTNCRFGLMFWQVGIICYAFKQYQLMGGYISSSMMVSIVLQTVYLFKFYYWETGYFCSMDIQHDRAGYYICWGCLVYVPSMYTVHTYFMTEQPVFLSLPATLFCLALGIFFIWANYDCDRFAPISHHLSPSLTISHHLSPPLTTSHHLSPPLSTSHHLSIYRHIALTYFSTLYISLFADKGKISELTTARTRFGESSPITSRRAIPPRTGRSAPPCCSARDGGLSPGTFAIEPTLAHIITLTATLYLLPPLLYLLPPSCTGTSTTSPKSLRHSCGAYRACSPPPT
jgi:7-dehydrocholesterol reductase